MNMDYGHSEDRHAKTSMHNGIAIVGVGLNCVSGTHPIDLFGAVGTHLGYTQPNFSLATLSRSKDVVEHIMTCAIANIDDENIHYRFMSCMLPALIDAIGSAKLLTRPHGNILFYLVMPPSGSLRGNGLLVNEFRLSLQNELSELGEVEIRIKTGKQSVTEHLMYVSEGLQDGHWDTVIFGAVDSLVHESTCHQLAKESRIQTTYTTEGVIPGEGAGFIILEQLDRQVDDTEFVIGWLKCFSVQQEPNYGQGDIKRMSGLGQAINSILNICDISKDTIDSLILPLGTEHSDLIEWHQTETILWPYINKDGAQQRGNEADKFPDTPEILNMSLSLGDIGVASLPVAIILALARFEFTHPVSRRILALESGDIPYRGAVYLEGPDDIYNNQELGDVA